MGQAQADDSNNHLGNLGVQSSPDRYGAAQDFTSAATAKNAAPVVFGLSFASSLETLTPCKALTICSD